MKNPDTIPARGASAALTPSVTTLVIVESQRMMRECLVARFKAEPAFAVVGDCGSPKDLIALAAALRPDVFIIGLWLSGTSAMTIISQLRPLYPDAAFVILADRYTVGLVRNALAAGARGYLLTAKPFETLIQGLRELAAAKRYALDPEINDLIPEIAFNGRDADDPLSILSPRETEVLCLVGSGLGTRETAKKLGVSQKTIETYRHNIMEKLGIRGDSKYAHTAIAHGLIEPIHFV